MSNVKQLKVKNSDLNFQLKSKDKYKKRAELVLYGTIGQDFWGDGITATMVSDALKEFKDLEQLDVRINSMGGDVFDGVTIYNRLKQLKANVTVYVDGLAASIASIIAMAGDEIVLSEGTLFMVHSPMTMVYGNQRDMQDTIELLDTIEDEMIGIYSRKTGLNSSELRNMLHKETWLTSEEAVELGFATSVSGEERMVACAESVVKRYSKMYKNCPENKIYTDTKKVQQSLKNSIKGIEDFLARK